MNEKYKDMLHLPHPVSATHPRMSLQDRAAQFSPFAALTGHSAAIEETARLTDGRKELEEDEYERLDETLRVIRAHLQEKPMVKIIYFVKDQRKQGGTYRTRTDRITAVDEYRGILQIQSGEKISVKDIIELEYMSEYDER